MASGALATVVPVTAAAAAATAQQQRTAVDCQQLAACISAATTCTQLESLCNTFMQHSSFRNSHATSVISRLHKVNSRPTDNQLLLVELLGNKLAGDITTSSSLQLSQHDIVAVCWSFAKLGHQPDASLLRSLLLQFWQPCSCDWQQPSQGRQQHQHVQQQQRQQQPTTVTRLASSTAIWLMGKH